MKKFFTLICALVGFASYANAETIDDVSVCKHSYVLVCDEFTNNGTEKIAKGVTYGDGFFFTPTGHDKANNKKSVDLSDAATWGEDIAAKYGEYGSHLNSMRIKNKQDVFAMKVTAGSKLIIFFNGQDKVGTAARLPLIATNADLTENVQDEGYLYTVTKGGNVLTKTSFNPANFAADDTIGVAKLEWTAPDDMTIYVGSYNGDTYISYVIVEANEAPGTPSVKVGPQVFENGLYYHEVTCKPAKYEMFGMQLATVVTYTTDGTDPTSLSPIYKEPIRCYSDQVIKFQAFIDYGDGVPADICEGADNDGIVTFSFNAPTITADGDHVTIETEYEGATNYYSYGDIADQEGSSFTLSESATVTAYTKIPNGIYTTFVTKTASKDVYVLDPIKEKKVIEVTAGTIVLDEEATATSTNGPVYIVENGEISADKMDFFIKDLELVGVKDPAYQVDGKEAYIKMNTTNITFMVAEGDSVDVTVTCSKNSCKDWSSEDEANHQCFVNVSGTNYGDTLKVVGEDIINNVIKFGLGAGTHTFQKYSGTGNIMIASLVIEPAETSGIIELKEDKKAAKTVKVAKNGQILIGRYNIAGQLVEPKK